MPGASRTRSGTGFILAAAMLAVLSLSGADLGGGYLQKAPRSNGCPSDTILAKRGVVGPIRCISSNRSYHVRLGKAKARDALEQAFRADLASRALPVGLWWVVSAVARDHGRADGELLRSRGPPMLSM